MTTTHVDVPSDSSQATTQMQVHLNHITPLHICSDAIRQCWQSQEKSDSYELVPSGEVECGPNDKALIDRIGNKYKHASTLEHITCNFTIEGISRALLQELARHRIASLSVKSTRYTLKELKASEPIMTYVEHDEDGDVIGHDINMEVAARFLVLLPEDSTGLNEQLNIENVVQLMKLRKFLQAGMANDKAKYCLPEAYKTSLAWTINARSLQNFLALRTSKSALWEIRQLANCVFDALPEEYKYIFDHCISTVN